MAPADDRRLAANRLLPRGLRSTANRRARPRKPPSANLLAAAERGELTRGNTRAGTAGRQAADRAEYQRRLAARPELGARQAVGQRIVGDVMPTVSFYGVLHGDPVLVERVTVSRRDASRVGRYLSLVAGLLDGRVTPAAFRRRVRTWRPVNVIDPAWGPVSFVSDPAIVVALAVGAQAQGVESWVDSGRRRSPRRGRK